jgi:PAS domain S-box-containing protein
MNVTQRYQTEAVLHENERLYRNTFENDAVGVIHGGLDDTFLQCNNKFCEMVGYARQDLIGKTWQSISHPDEIAFTQDLRQRHLRGETDKYSLEKRYIHKSGQMIWVNVTVSLLCDDTAKPLYYIAFVEDISARKKIEESLRQREEDFRTLANNISQFAWMTDATGWIFWYNQRWFDYTGSTLEDMQGWGWQKVHHPDHVDQVVAHISHCFETGQEWEDTFPLRGKDGHYRWFLSRALPIRNDQGQIVRWFGTNTDVTEQRQAEEHSGYLAGVLADVSDAIISTDLEFCVQSWNTGAEITYGWTAQEAIGKPVRELINTTFESGTEEVAAKQLRETGKWQGEVTQYHKDGRVIPVLSSVTLRRDEEGQSIGAVASNRDISVRRRAEERLRFLNEASLALVSSLDLESSLRSMAQSMVPGLADWCSISLSDAEGKLENLEVVHTDPERVQQVRDLSVLYPEDPEDPNSSTQLMQTRRSLLLPEVSDALLIATARDEKHLELLRSLEVGSALIVPMMAGTKAVGLIGLGMTAGHRSFDKNDLLLVEELGRRVAIALENVRLYQQTRISEERFRAVQQTTPDGFMIFESVRNDTGQIEDFRWLYVNPAAQSIVGMSDDYLVGNRLLEVMPGNKEEGLFDAYVNVVERGQPWQREFKYSHEGINKWFRSTAAKTTDGFAVSFADITENKTFEQALRTSEIFNRTVLQSSPDCVKVLDLVGTIVFTNENGLCLLELDSFEQVRGCAWWELWPPAQHTELRGLFQQALVGKTSHYRGFAPTHKGTPKWWDVVVSPVKADTDAVTQVLVVSRDITEAQELEAEIRVNEERYRSLIESTSDIVWQRDEHGDFSTVQREWGKYTGQNFDAYRGQGWLDAVHPEDRERTEQCWSEAVASKGIYRIEYRMRRHDGVYIWFSVRAAPVLSDSGEVKEWIGTHTDISKRKESETKILEQAQLLHEQNELLLLANEVIIVRDSENRIISWNKAATDLYGYSEAEAVGQVTHGFLKTKLPDSLESLGQALKTTGFWEGELEHRRKDGTHIHLLSRQAARRDSEGNIREIVEVNWNITERKQDELEKERLLKISQRSEREALALAQIASSFSLARPLETNFSEIAKRLTQTMNARACSIELYEADTQRLHLVGSYGMPPSILEEVRQNQERYPTAHLSSEEIRVIRNYLTIIAPHLSKQAKLDWGHAVDAPIRGVTTGRIIIVYKKGDEPTLSDFLQLSTITSQIALVAENLRLFVEWQGKAALEERQRLARDLHDSVSQALFGISLGANSAKQAFARNDSERKAAEVNRSLDYLIHMAETATAEMKSLIFELRPESLEQEGLVVAIQKHLRALQLRHRFELELELGEEPQVSIKAKEMLYRIMQEAMNNIVKHAQASRIRVVLVKTDDIGLIIEDNGRGFDVSQSFPGHLGLSTMRERAETLGGSYNLSSTVGSGTTIQVTLPLTV